MYKTIDEIKTANSDLGHHFFENQWCMKIPDPRIFSGRYFVTEDFIDLGAIQLKPKFTIREARPDGSIATVGEYRNYESVDQAIKNMPREGEQ